MLGPSGCGKSSLALAGLVPWLRNGAIEGSRDWPVAILKPGQNPLRGLARGLVIGLDSANPHETDAERINRWVGMTDGLQGRFGDDPLHLHHYAEIALHQRPAGSRLLVVVDQFEEIFTRQPSGKKARKAFDRSRDAFLSNLLHATTVQEGRVVVVITMRTDFLGASASFETLNAVLSAHQEQVGPMSPTELREAIERPAFQAGSSVEPALVERLLADVAGEPGALPLLQFALTELWKRRDGRGALTLRAYEELGGEDKHGRPRGIEGVLDRRADAIYEELSPEDRKLCRSLFLRLIQLGEGVEDTRRRVSFSELLPDDPGRSQAVRQLVQDLAHKDTRLLTTEGGDAADGAVEVAHEALIRGWSKLRGWIGVERVGMRIHRRLTEAAKEWAGAKPEGKADYLYKGAPLTVCREWAASRREVLNPQECAFLEASEAAEAKRKRNQRRRMQGLVATAVLMGLLATIAGGLGFWANSARTREMEQRKLAEKTARIAESRRLAVLSDQVRPGRLDVAMLLAVEASREDTLEARGSLQRALDTRPEVTRFLDVPEGRVNSVAFGPDDTIAAGYSGVVIVIVIGIGGGGVVRFDARGTRLSPAPLEVKEGSVTNVAFGPDGILAAGYGNGVGGGVVLFDAWGTRLSPSPLVVEEGDVTSVAFRPDGTLAAGYGNDDGGGVVLFNARGRRLSPAPLEVKEGYATSVAFRPDGTLAVLYGDEDDGVVLFNARGQRLSSAPLKVEEGPARSVAFGPGGTLAAGYNRFVDGGGVVLFDVDPASWRRKAAAVANRNLTLAEWAEFFPGETYRPIVLDFPGPGDDPEHAEIARNLAWEAWRRYFPDTPYRRVFRSQPWPEGLPDAERQRAEEIENTSPQQLRPAAT